MNYDRVLWQGLDPIDSMNIGYARTSTVDQLAGLEAQVAELQVVGCEKIFYEQVSSISVRAELQAAIEFARKGDVLVVTKIDRLARSVADLLVIIKTLEERKVDIRILNLGMETKTPTGKLMLTVLAGVAQFEREIMLERQREGVAKARMEGKYKGRKSTSLYSQQEVIRLNTSGMSKANIARQLGIGEATIYRILRQLKQKPKQLKKKK